jgi:hypothetical protein
MSLIAQFCWFLCRNNWLFAVVAALGIASLLVSGVAYALGEYPRAAAWFLFGGAFLLLTHEAGRALLRYGPTK